MLSGLVDPVFDGHYAALDENDFTLPSSTATDADKNWIARRRACLWTQLQAVRPAFRITTPNNSHSSTAEFTLAGDAPVEVKDLQVNGAAATVLWTGATTWSITTTLTDPATELTVTGHRWDGAQLQEHDLGDYEDTITVYYP